MYNAVYLLAEVVNALDIFGLGLISLGDSRAALPLPVLLVVLLLLLLPLPLLLPGFGVVLDIIPTETSYFFFFYLLITEL